MNVQTKTSQKGINYYIVYPNNHNQNETSPALLFLHGAGERGNTVEAMSIIQNHWPLAHTDYEKFPFILIAPQCHKESYWPLEIYNLKALLDELIDAEVIDAKKLYLTGLSMGGYGTWYMSYRFPTLFKAVAPICGAGIKSSYERLTKLPIWAFHGTKDPVIPCEESIHLANSINANGGNVKLTLYEGVTHNSWQHAYKDQTLYDWLLSQ